MFKLEFFSLLKEIKNSQGTQRQELLKSLQKLIQEHKEEYEYFIEQGLINEEMKEIINEAENSQKNINNYHNNSEDIEKLKISYNNWLEEYNNSGNTTPKMSQIVQELVQFYTPNRFETLKKFLEVEDTPEFEKFKTHIKNTLRTYFAEQIENYIESDKYQKLWFLQRYRKNKEIRELLKEINNYQFNKEKISEVLQ